MGLTGGEGRAARGVRGGVWARVFFLAGASVLLVRNFDTRNRFVDAGERNFGVERLLALTAVVDF
jgi:hypothetical protein